MVVALMIPLDNHERLRVGTQQHLPTFVSKFGREPSTWPMDRDIQQWTKTLTTRAHELKIVSVHAVLLVTVNNQHNERLQSTLYTQKYINRSVFGTETTNTRTNVHKPLTLQPHQPRDHCWHASSRLGRQQPSMFSWTSFRDSCAT